PAAEKLPATIAELAVAASFLQFEGIEILGYFGFPAKGLLKMLAHAVGGACFTMSDKHLTRMARHLFQPVADFAVIAMAGQSIQIGNFSLHGMVFTVNFNRLGTVNQTGTPGTLG